MRPRHGLYEACLGSLYAACSQWCHCIENYTTGLGCYMKVSQCVSQLLELVLWLQAASLVHSRHNWQPSCSVLRSKTKHVRCHLWLDRLATEQDDDCKSRTVFEHFCLPWVVALPAGLGVSQQSRAGSFQHPCSGCHPCVFQDGPSLPALKALVMR